MSNGSITSNIRNFCVEYGYHGIYGIFFAITWFWTSKEFFYFSTVINTSLYIVSISESKNKKVKTDCDKYYTHHSFTYSLVSS